MQVLCKKKVGNHTTIAISVGLSVRRYEYLAIQQTRDFYRRNLQGKFSPAGEEVKEKDLGRQLPVPDVKLVVGNIPLDGNFVRREPLYWTRFRSTGRVNKKSV
jgi:hypothetical protein